MVPVVDLSRRLQRHEGDLVEAVRRVARSGRLLLGDELDAFEHELVDALDLPPAVAVSSGAAALQLTLDALGIGPGDEVIVPALTAVPTASAVCAVGATPVPVDVEPDTAAIDPRCVADAITDRTCAIVPVHLYGRPADVSTLTRFGPSVVEDAAQAHGALRSVSGIAAILSFYPTKNIGGIGDGGAVVTADAHLRDHVRRRRAHGMTEQYVHVEISQNHRMSEIEAAWLRLQLPSLAADNARRAAIARAYRAAAPSLGWQDDHPDHVFHLCVATSPRRDEVRAMLADRGVATAIHYPLAITQQPAYQRFAHRECPVAERWAATCFTLPCFPELTDSEVEQVVDALGAMP
jgi:dTDP-4-amino-4,6-dideoxygalactose transaminase